jgi:hypothetical protein
MSARVWATVRITNRERHDVENEKQSVLGAQYHFTKAIIQRDVSEVLRRRTLSRDEVGCRVRTCSKEYRAERGQPCDSRRYYEVGKV